MSLEQLERPIHTIFPFSVIPESLDDDPNLDASVLSCLIFDNQFRLIFELWDDLMHLLEQVDGQVGSLELDAEVHERVTKNGVDGIRNED